MLVSEGTASAVDDQVVADALSVLGKVGELVITSLAPATYQVKAGSDALLTQEQSIHATLYGTVNPRFDILRLLDLSKKGQLNLDDLITRTYSLEQINQGYEDLLNGKLIRGVIEHDN